MEKSSSLPIRFKQLFFLIILGQGTCKLHNMDDDARKFVDGLKRHGGYDIDEWNLSPAYFNQRISDRGKMYPITAKVEQVQCNIEELYPTGWAALLVKGCQDEHSWKIHNGILSPVPLFAEVHVPMIPKRGAENRTARINFSNATEVIWAPEPRDQPARKKQPMYQYNKTCNFTAKASFSGWFAVHAKGPGRPYYKAFGIGYLQNIPVKLYQRGVNKLSYEFKGTYRQTTCELPRRHLSYSIKQ